MVAVPHVMISSKEAELDAETREEIERRCRALYEEFPETTHFEITIAHDGDGHIAHGHVTGKNTEIASHAQAPKPAHAADRLMDTLEKQLRRVHDKRIFGRRREAKRNSPKRKS